MDRNEAIKVVGLAAVEAVETAHCEPTGRCGYNGACQGDELTEWSASLQGYDDWSGYNLSAYYYTTNTEDEDPDCIEWAIDHYEVV